jgi:DNA polymerase-4
VSHERTFARDVADGETLAEQLQKLSRLVGRRLEQANLAAGTVAIKLRYADFETLTRQTTLSVPTTRAEEIYHTAMYLFQRTWEQGRPVRLLGVAGRHLSEPAGQLPLGWEDEG